jgi:hypothetical protein
VVFGSVNRGSLRLYKKVAFWEHTLGIHSGDLASAGYLGLNGEIETK